MTPARILVVDDEAGMLRAVERVLGGTHQVVTSRSSSDAVALAASFDPVLAILDVRMPDLDGFELMSRLHAQKPNLDVILMTGSVDDLDEKLVRAIRGRAFYFIQKPFDREVLQTLVDRCLELRWRRDERRRYLQRLETELAEARTFQQGLLPARESVVGPLAICCRYAPSSELGGDLYDYAEGSSGQAALLLADVSGHGASAAMLTATVKSAFRASHSDGYDPLAVVESVAKSLAPFSAERFVTLFAAVVSADATELRYVNAGHPPGFLWSEGRTPLALSGTGPLIAPAIPWCRWNVESVSITAGDRLLLYTDGVSDVLVDYSEAGDDGIRAAIEQHPAGGDALLDALVADVEQQRTTDIPQDDLTVMTAHVLAPTSSERPRTPTR
jgi:sigma-B regulation protein RsbU (phosphoserine phosphatase)